MVNTNYIKYLETIATLDLKTVEDAQSLAFEDYMTKTTNDNDVDSHALKYQNNLNSIMLNLI
jgi:hypothetical protein